MDAATLRLAKGLTVCITLDYESLNEITPYLPAIIKLCRPYVEQKKETGFRFAWTCAENTPLL